MADRRYLSNAAYRQAQIRARAVAGGLEAQTAEEIRNALEDYSRTLERELLSLTGTRAAEVRLQIQVLDDARQSLTKALEAAVGDARAVSYAQVQKIWQDASIKVARAEEIPQRLLGAVQAPPISLLGAYGSLGSGSATWKTLLAEYAGAATKDVDHVVQMALLQGVSPEKLARQLRPYVVGADTVQDLVNGLPGITLRNLRGAPPDVLGAAGRMRYNSRRIAFSEVHNARKEAEVVSFAADPLIKAVAWRLSPSRGSLLGSDECDALAASDLYGLGPGVYPVDAVPWEPHPFGRCEAVPVTRPTADAEAPKPTLSSGTLTRGTSKDVRVPGRVTREKADRIRANVMGVVEESSRVLPSSEIAGLADGAVRGAFVPKVIGPSAVSTPVQGDIQASSLKSAWEARKLSESGLTNKQVGEELKVSASRVSELLKINKQYEAGVPIPEISGRLTNAELETKLQALDVGGPTRETLDKAREAGTWKLAGKTHKEIADLMGVSPSRISEYLKIDEQVDAGVPVPKILVRGTVQEIQDNIDAYGFRFEGPAPAPVKKGTPKKAPKIEKKTKKAPKIEKKTKTAGVPELPPIDPDNVDFFGFQIADAAPEGGPTEPATKELRAFIKEQDVPPLFTHIFDRVAKMGEKYKLRVGWAQESSGSQYRPSLTRIQIGSENGKHLFGSYFHEIGHYLDNLLGKLDNLEVTHGGVTFENSSPTGVFAKLVAKYRKVMKESWEAGSSTSDSFLSKAKDLTKMTALADHGHAGAALDVEMKSIWDAGRQELNVGDIFGSISRGKYGFIGHTANYYKYIPGEMEVFANLTHFWALQNSPDYGFIYQNLRKMMPDLIDEYETLMSKLFQAVTEGST